MDFNQTSLSPNSTKSKGGRLVGLVVIILVLAVIVALLVVLSRNNKNLIPVGTNPDNILTDEKKLEILNQIPAVEKPLSDEEKIKALESIPATESPMTDEEKIKILNSI